MCPSYSHIKEKLQSDETSIPFCLGNKLKTFARLKQGYVIEIEVTE